MLANRAGSVTTPQAFSGEGEVIASRLGAGNGFRGDGERNPAPPSSGPAADVMHRRAEQLISTDSRSRREREYQDRVSSGQALDQREERRDHLIGPASIHATRYEQRDTH